MNKFRFTIKMLVIATFVLAFTSIAQAQATRTWVSGVGDDVNPCSRTAPCKTYAGAISKTAQDGEISTLDPGGFGAVTITKSLTINGTKGQGYGSILASFTTGVIVNITAAADTRKTVRLVNLDINGAPVSQTGINGVRILAATAVHIEDTVIDGFRSATVGEGNGIKIDATNNVQVHLRNCTIRNNREAGIRASTTAGQIVLSVIDCKINNNTTGIHAINGVAASIVGSTINSNTTGIDAEEGALPTLVNVDSCNIAFGTNGIQAGAGASDVRITNNFITQNATGISIAGGTVNTSGNNRIIGNTTAVGGGALQPVTQPQ